MMRRSVKIAWCAFVCAVVMGLCVWGMVWGYKNMNAREQDEESRKNYEDTTCVVLNVTPMDGGCFVVRVQHHLYKDEITQLQWTYPFERNVTACNMTIPFDAGEQILVYADRAFIRVFVHKGSRPPEDAGGVFGMSLLVASLAFVGVIMLPVAAWDQRCKEIQLARRPPPIPDPAHHQNVDEGYIDN